MSEEKNKNIFAEIKRQGYKIIVVKPEAEEAIRTLVESDNVVGMVHVDSDNVQGLEADEKILVVKG